MLSRFLLAVILAVAAVPAAVNAQQYAAQTTTTVNMREGPGTQYRVILAIPGGTNVGVEGCLQGYTWCRVLHQGARGWVSARYLRDPRRGAPVSDVGAQLGLALLQFFLGQIPRPPGQPQPPQPPTIPNDQVCFYQDFNYGGASFCAGPGSRDNALPASWNDRISSIRVGSASGGVTVCREFNYQGQCDFFTRNVAQLDSTRNDTISSYRVGPGGPGPGPFPPPPPPPPPVGQVCFYDDWNFGGQSFCAGPGEQDADLMTFNDRISSIRVGQGVFVQVCPDYYFQGQCASLGNSVSQLTGAANDSISSFRVFTR